MSRPRYWWYESVVRTIRAYPTLAAAKAGRQRQAVTAAWSSAPYGHRNGRKTETVALRQLSPREEKELDAVRIAMEDVGRQRDGGEVLRIVELVDWRGLTIDEAARKTHMSPRTVRRRRTRFIYAVAKNCGRL